MFSFGNTLTFDKILAIKSQGQYIIIETGSMKYVIKCKSYNEANEIKNLLPIIK